MAGVRSETWRYVGRRLLGYLVSVVAAFTVSFFFFHLIPGNPIEAYITRLQQSYGYSAPVASSLISFYEKEFGIQGSIWHQYLLYLRNVLLHGNLGISFIAFPTPAQRLIAAALPWTIGLFGLAALLAWLLGVALGIVVGWFRQSPASQWATTVALGLSQIPYYLVALALVYLLAYHFSVFPVSDAYDPALHPGWNLAFVGSVIRHATLPALSLVLVGLSGWLVSTRSLVVSILGEDYLLFAEAKGLRPARILNRYVLRNVMLPQVTGLAISLGFVVNGAYLVEYIFNWPGIGYLFVQALGQLDYNVIEGVVLMSILAVLTANLIIDLLLPLFDPRVRYQ